MMPSEMSKNINNVAKKIGPVIDAVSVVKDAVETDLDNPQEVGDFVENTLETAVGLTPLIGPGLGVVMDDAKKEDGVTNVENLSNAYQKSFNDRNKLLEMHLKIKKKN